MRLSFSIVHYKFIAFTATVNTIPPFGILIKRIRLIKYRKHILQIQQEKQEANMLQAGLNKSKTNKASPIQPILPLIRTAHKKDEEDKSCYITFEIKARAGAPATSQSYKKAMRLFEEGTPEEWMEVLSGVKDLWRQNSITGPANRSAIINAIVKGDSWSAFESALEEARLDPNPDNIEVPLPLTVKHIKTALEAVMATIFPH